MNLKTIKFTLIIGIALIFALIFTFTACNRKGGTVTTAQEAAQQFEEGSTDALTNLSPSVTQFVPKGYAILNITSGNLNLDQYTDMIMVLKEIGEDGEEDSEGTRPLLILLGQEDNSYKLVARNDNVVFPIIAGGVKGDPFQRVIIENGTFSIEHFGGSRQVWTNILTFKYSSDDSNWYVHEHLETTVDTFEPDNETTERKTTKDFGNIPFDKFEGVWSLAGNQQQAAADHVFEIDKSDYLCADNEDILIGFKMENSSKILTVCIEKNDGYIVYRYGTKENIELEFPQNKADSWSHFTYEMSWGKVYNSYLITFNNGGYRYSVSHGLDFDDYQNFQRITCSISITNIATEKNTRLTGVPESIIGGLVDLPDNVEDYRNSRQVERLIKNKKLLKIDWGYMNLGDENKKEYY